ncbi:ATP-binding protein [Streptomyces sp. NPDC002790]|uniref:ATP-binding protein n=1 Tax=Streptomyces sp. NPDC002790 TaxID=3154431 RepID=UPI00331AD0E1
MNAPAPQRLTAVGDGGLVEEQFPITRRRPGELLSRIDGLRVAAMRRLTRHRLVSCGLACVADDATLVVSELITNAINHSGGQRVSLTLGVRDGVLRIRVHDGVADSWLTTMRNPIDDDENGRGLAVVRGIARSREGTWGVSDGGATTWCELNLAAC